MTEHGSAKSRQLASLSVSTLITVPGESSVPPPPTPIGAFADHQIDGYESTENSVTTTGHLL